MEEGAKAKPSDPGRIPRLSCLLALATHMEELVRRGEVADCAELARLGHVTRARMTHIMNLVLLAPTSRSGFASEVYDAVHALRSTAVAVGRDNN